jgi:hypothetical protein
MVVVCVRFGTYTKVVGGFVRYVSACAQSSSWWYIPGVALVLYTMPAMRHTVQLGAEENLTNLLVWSECDYQVLHYKERREHLRSKEELYENSSGV